MGTLGLKIDVDTYEGMKQGVPRLLQTLKEFNLKGTFFLSIGPDNSGRENRTLWNSAPRSDDCAIFPGYCKGNNCRRA